MFSSRLRTENDAVRSGVDAARSRIAGRSSFTVGSAARVKGRISSRMIGVVSRRNGRVWRSDGPSARAALPTVKELRPAMRDLAAATPDLTRSFSVINRLLNEVAYNPPGAKEEGFLFWQSWVNHAGNAIFSTSDAHGPIRRGLVVLSCSTAQLLEAVAATNPQLGTIIGLLNAPTKTQICPQSTAPPASGGTGG